MRPGDEDHRFEDIAAVACPGLAVRDIVVDATEPRRRAAILVGGRRRAPAAVVKVARTAAEGDRGADEQRRLRELHDRGVANVPRPLGHGTEHGLSWSAESWVPGVRWDLAPGRWRRRHERPMLDALASWLDGLASCTAHAAASGEHLGDAPAVLVHGDLASGTNVLVHGATFTVIDWETAMDDGLPLVDLLPTLALALARARSDGSAEGRAAYALRLCRGELDESSWLFDRVTRHLRGLGLGVEAAGPLALEAWGYQASMRARHDALVLAAGGQPVVWTSPAEIVLDGWVQDASLGTEWRALAERS